MKKNISVVSKGLVIEVGSLKKSHINGWVSIHSKDGEIIGGFDLLDSKLKVIHKSKIDNCIKIVYSIIDKEVKQ